MARVRGPKAFEVRRGSGPIAIDAERAQGYRYSARAYLIQLRRADAGTFLIDPMPFTQDGAPVTSVCAVLTRHTIRG